MTLLKYFKLITPCFYFFSIFLLTSIVIVFSPIIIEFVPTSLKFLFLYLLFLSLFVFYLYVYSEHKQIKEPAVMLLKYIEDNVENLAEEWELNQKIKKDNTILYQRDTNEDFATDQIFNQYEIKVIEKLGISKIENLISKQKEDELKKDEKDIDLIRKNIIKTLKS